MIMVAAAAAAAAFQMRNCGQSQHSWRRWTTNGNSMNVMCATRLPTINIKLDLIQQVASISNCRLLDFFFGIFDFRFVVRTTKKPWVHRFSSIQPIYIFRPLNWTVQLWTIDFMRVQWAKWKFFPPGNSKPKQLSDSLLKVQSNNNKHTHASYARSREVHFPTNRNTFQFANYRKNHFYSLCIILPIGSKVLVGTVDDTTHRKSFFWSKI